MTQSPSTPPLQNDAGRRSQVLGLWDPTALAQEMFGAWSCACGAWGVYLERLATASGPDAVIDAATRLMTDSLELCSRAAAARLRGLRGPLLKDV